MRTQARPPRCWFCGKTPCQCIGIIGLTLLLFVAPLSAQDPPQTVVAVPNVINEITVTPTPFVNNITVMSDSATIANLVENNRLLREMIQEERECDTCGGASTTAKLGLGAAIPLLVWIAIELRGIKNKNDSHTVNNTVKAEPHEHEPEPDDHESDENDG